jgi:hypothetical protein
MDVCDMAGDKVGTIAHVYRYADAVVGVGTTTAADERPPYEEVIEVKTGFLDLARTCTFH